LLIKANHIALTGGNRHFQAGFCIRSRLTCCNLVTFEAGLYLSVQCDLAFIMCYFSVINSNTTCCK